MLSELWAQVKTLGRLASKVRHGNHFSPSINLHLRLLNSDLPASDLHRLEVTTPSGVFTSFLDFFNALAFLFLPPLSLSLTHSVKNQ